MGVTLFSVADSGLLPESGTPTCSLVTCVGGAVGSDAGSSGRAPPVAAIDSAPLLTLALASCSPRFSSGLAVLPSSDVDVPVECFASSGGVFSGEGTAISYADFVVVCGTGVGSIFAVGVGFSPVGTAVVWGGLVVVCGLDGDAILAVEDGSGVCACSSRSSHPRAKIIRIHAMKRSRVP